MDRSRRGICQALPLLLAGFAERAWGSEETLTSFARTSHALSRGDGDFVGMLRSVRRSCPASYPRLPERPLQEIWFWRMKGSPGTLFLEQMRSRKAKGAKSPAGSRPPLSEILKDPASATRVQPAVPDICRTHELAPALPARFQDACCTSFPRAPPTPVSQSLRRP